MNDAQQIPLAAVPASPKELTQPVSTRPVPDPSAPRSIDSVESALDAGSHLLSRMSVEDLKAELATTITITARHLIHIADLWQELLRRGEDLSELRSGLWQYMPFIASGELRPELVVRYAGNSRLLQRLAALPRYEQDIILSNDMVTLVESVAGNISHRLVRIDQLRAREIGQVFKDRIVSKKEQENVLIRREQMNEKLFPENLRKKIIGGAFAKPQRETGKTGNKRSFSIELSSEEWKSLEAAAQKSGTTISSIVVSVLRAITLV